MKSIQKPQRSIRQKIGFTLVELAIVLVIIGLLIGGVLVGKSLIDTSKKSSQILQFQQLDAAITSFNDKFRGFPGDTSTMGCIADGNNTCDDGYLQDGQNGDPSTVWFSSEVTNFWPDLSESGLGSSNPYSNSFSFGSFNNNGQNAPRSKIDSKASIIPHSAGFFDGGGWRGTDPVYNGAFYYNAYRVSYQNNIDADLGMFPSCVGTVYSGDIDPVPYYIALAIDQKIDDGDLSYNNFSTNETKIFAYHYGDGSDCHECASTDKKCTLYVRMGASAGTTFDKFN